MDEIMIRAAEIKDRLQLLEVFNFFKSNEVNKKRVDCYTSHNHTIIAERNDAILGVVQWYIKEDPNLGVAELEQVFVDKAHRKKGVGTNLINQAIHDIKKFFYSIEVIPRRIFLFVNSPFYDICCSENPSGIN